MPLNIGELFVNLGIKGGDKSLSMLKGVREGMKGITSSSLETKAAIVGALYGLNRLMANSAQAGTNLVTFASRTQLSIEYLQKMQYAMTQAGGTAEEMQASIEGISSAIGAMEAGLDSSGQIASGLARIGQQTGGLDPSRFKDNKYVLEKARDYFKTTTDSFGIQEMVRNSLKLGEHFVSGSKRNIFEESVFAKAPQYKPGQAEQLDKINIAWTNLWKKIEMSIGDLNSKHGLQLIQTITLVVDGIKKFFDGLLTIAEKLHVFEAINKTLFILGNVFGAMGKIADNFSLGESGPYGSFLKFFSNATEKVKDVAGLGVGEKPRPEWERAEGGIAGEGWLAKAAAGAGQTVINNNNVFNISGYPDGKRIGEDAARVFDKRVQSSAGTKSAKVRQN